MRIAVAGDVRIDWLALSVPPAARGADGGPPLAWQRFEGTRMIARPGGALLLARLVGLATGAAPITHELEGLELVPPDAVVHSIHELEPLPRAAGTKGDAVHRVARHRGFSGPGSGAPTVLPVAADDPQADLVVLEDAANGFRDAPDCWPAALRADGSRPIVVLATSRPLAAGQLWNELADRHADRLVVVVAADDLRAERLNISRQLSWERTATDFVWQIGSHAGLVPLASCRNLVVRLGLDGAIHHSAVPGRVETRLYYDPAVAEGGFRAACPGDMVGCSSAFVAALAARLASDGLDGVGEGVRAGIRAARRLLQRGFGPGAGEPSDPGADVFDDAGGPPIADVVVPQPASPGASWSILRHVREHQLEDVAQELVLHGGAAALHGVPVARFGFLTTVDRGEIESLRAISNLIRNYLAREKPGRPLSLAVFGPPGSGKSFAVTQVATSVSTDVTPLEFNVAQFTSVADLVGAFHRVRDVGLKGEVPLVFFDEFDSPFDGKLGWLRYFLAPMQDGEFSEAGTPHPIGRAIFVFAGGTSATFAEFSREGADEPAQQAFRDAKGPDFVSRLRGYVDILGPNPTGDGDYFALIRRASLLRSLLERKLPRLVDGAGGARIDPGVLRACLKVPRYKHGARSLEAIVDMSSIRERDGFQPASLPPADQLDLHVDAETFARLVLRDVLFGAARDAIAAAIHEKFRRDHGRERSPDDHVMRPWEELAEQFKDSNRQQADHIPAKLRAIRCGFAPAAGREPARIELTDDEVEVLARLEHDRFVEERLRAGWTLGSERDPERKISPYLVPWDELPDDVKDYDYDTVRGMPEFMADAGFEIYRFD
jgi:hypothetical protein